MPPDLPLLAFDTSAAHCAAALVLRGVILAQTREDMAKGQSERLMPMIESMLTGAGLCWRDLGAVAVGVGPGNFTGIRISVAAARGLALGLGVPAVGVTGLEVLAFGATGRNRVALPAPRGAFYLQDFDGENAITEPFDATLDNPNLWPADPSVGMIGDWPETAKVLRPDTDARLRALAHLGVRHVANGAHLPKPFYMRAADAAPPSDPPPVILDL
ncbi:tRNA (adenosine(37)-N6)-threonylcarbamoyltransferase complex dimerization subunit type 1 TsaB [Pseudorhodobacter ferrugineus]|uniref:tRNA (adenosine(37)-N6)-threonylcarbamoyltransferase complex dimerization subunit type 1 TsaB n=1 Tax=Pseudorhodobacter ferrugineus TaxID=77008 RepID=UPI0003B5A6E2|nr:tRNA (adenosine(37)-N6)-threonylcarbamoyltransferase complex dimerization subunit type 1 TsaB [Pseudorhodobacter ferrugineus]